MMPRLRFIGLFFGLATLTLLAGYRFFETPAAVAEEKPAANAAKSDETPQPTSFKHVEPVEHSMHEIMEYVFEEPYKRLKANLPGETHDRVFYRALKSDSLILAEGGNMLLMRLPKEDAAAWTELSIAVRAEATELYKAGKAKDVEGARKSFKSLVLKCNACHDHFADGEHQLTP